MRCCLGVDLGSTMSKAVLLDDEGCVLGAAACSTRGRHVDSIARASSAAEDVARLTLLQRALRAAGCDQPLVTRLRSGVERELGTMERRRDLGRLGARVSSLPADAALMGAMHDVLERLAAHPGQAAASLRDELCAELSGNADDVARRHGTSADRLIPAMEAAAFACDAEPRASMTIEDLRAALRAALECEDERHIQAQMAARCADHAGREPLELVGRTGTGYGRHTLPFEPNQMRSEILCHARGAHRLFPGTRTVLDIGGQDTKAIHVDRHGVVLSFQMNDRCAAGCGRFLGYVADELGLALDDMATHALVGVRPATISSTCTVFAGAEVRELLASGVPLDDVLAGLHAAVAERAVGLLSRAGEIGGEVTFTGGVSRNPAVVAAVRTLLDRYLGGPTLNVAPDALYAGALGAALFALDGARSAP